jgi:polysaccharide biosynthesis transport protein
MRNSARLPSEDVAIISLWSVLMRSWLRVLIVAGFAGAAVFTALALAPVRYTATIEIRLPAPVSEGAVAATVAALQSADLARKLVADLDLAQSPAFNGAFMARDVYGWLDRLSGRSAPRSAKARDEHVLTALKQSLRIAPGRKNGLLTISVTARTPDLAARIVDHLVDLRIAAAEPAGMVPAADARTALDREIRQLSEDVMTIEAEIARLSGLSGGTAQAERRNDLAEALVQAERERGDAEARARAVRTLLEKGKVEAIAELQTSPTLHQLIAERVRIEVQKNGAERTLPSNHPRIRDLQAHLSELRWQMFREATAIAEALEVEVQTAAAQEAEARARVESADARAHTPAGPAQEAGPLAALEQDAATKRRTLEALKARRAATIDTPLSPPARSAAPERLSSAQAVAIPAFPRKGQLALLTAVAVLMVGFVAVIMRTLLAGTRRSITETGFADLAASARDRADVRLDAPPHDARQPAPRPADDVRAKGTADDAAAETRARTAEPGQFVILSTTADAARHLAGRAMGRKGHRALLVNDGIDGAVEARELATSLATAGRRCVLVDWARDGRGLAVSLGAGSRPGINGLLDGRAGFDDVIVRLPDSDAHFIAAGDLPADPARPLNADWINLVLDALDEAYDHIIVAAQLDEARNLFEAIEGRFDAGIVMSDRRGQGSTINAGPGVFLGFEVTEIYIVQMDLAQRRGAARRLKRARRQAAA